MMSELTYLRRLTAIAVAAVCAFLSAMPILAESPVRDMGRAREICDSLDLRAPEGIWVYPDDNVTVLVARETTVSPTSLPSYSISVVETTDCTLRPGDTIGELISSPDPKKFTMRLFSERKKGVFSKPRECQVTLGNEGETLILGRESKKGLRFRFSINPNTLLPKMWRILRFGVSTNQSKGEEAPVGMVRIYPSYDGNGSSRRAPRYL